MDLGAEKIHRFLKNSKLPIHVFSHFVQLQTLTKLLPISKHQKKQRSQVLKTNQRNLNRVKCHPKTPR